MENIMQEKELQPADAILARCTKCRRNTNHVIVALIDGKPEKVECNVCERQHKYRPPSKTTKASSRPAAAPKNQDQKKWALRCASPAGEKIQPYAMSGSYRADSLIDHPVFGLGIVQQVIGAQKIEVLFEAGTKIMRCK